MKKVAFIFPPFIPMAAAHPYLSIELLTSILKDNGYECLKLDYNLESCYEVYRNNLYEDFLAQDDLTEHNRMLYERASRYQKQNPDAKTLPGWIWQQANMHLAKACIEAPKTLEEFFEIGVKIHPKFDEIIDKYIDQLVEEKLDVIAFSVAFGEQLTYGLEMIERVKKRLPDTPVILGGAQISLLDAKQIKLIKEHSSTDLIFQGYAEDNIVDVIEKLSVCREKPLTLSGGTSTREKMKGIPFSKFDYDRRYNGSKRYPVLVTKGCYWGKCKFCDYILMGDLGGERYIARPVEEVYEELKFIRQHDPDAEFMLISDAVPPNFYKNLAKLANADDFKLKTHSYMINNKALNEEFFKEIAKADVKGFVFGTESTSDRVLDLMSKQADRETIIDNLRLAQKYNLKVKVNLIPNYPTTTFKEAFGAYEILSKYKDTISSLAVFKFYLSANTSMFQNPSEYGIEVNDAPYLKSDHNGFHTVEYNSKDGMTPVEEKKIYFLLHSLNNTIKTQQAVKLIKESLESKSYEKIFFRSSFSWKDNGGKKALKDVALDFSIECNDNLLSIVDRIYTKDLIPKYNTVKEFLDDNEDGAEIIEVLFKNKLISA